MAIFPVGIPYSLQKPKNPYCRDFSLRVATLVRRRALRVMFNMISNARVWRNNRLYD